MRTYEELQSGCAEIIRNLREKAGLSRTKMADLIGIDVHTLGRYESGKSAPSVPEFIRMFQLMGEDPFVPVLRYIYPEMYAGDDDEDQLRRNAAHYVTVLASPEVLRQLNYLTFGGHGSSSMAQLQMMIMIDHMPMAYRYAVAEMVNALWSICEAQDGLIQKDRAMPNMDLFRACLMRGRAAAMQNRNSYTDIIASKKAPDESGATLGGEKPEQST